MSITTTVCNALDAVRQRHPLVHNITNYVVMNTTANSLLALGAAPIMAHAPEEMAEIAAISNALVLNIGTLSTPWIDSMLIAGRAAHEQGIPIILDPVGAGATKLRTDTTHRLLAELRPQVLRGNASEILALTDTAAAARGVDSRHTTSEAEEAALHLARKHGNVVAVTGEIDFITDGIRCARVRNGHPLMERITGSGCALTSIIGALCGVLPDYFEASVAALVIYCIAGEMAADDASGPGSFNVRLIDALDQIQAHDLRRGIKVEISNAE